MTMTREEALAHVNRFRRAATHLAQMWRSGQFAGPAHDDALCDTLELQEQLIAALCTNPNAELLEACKRLYDICYVFAVRPVNDLSGDAAAELGQNLCITDLNWAKEAIAKAEEG